MKVILLKDVPKVGGRYQVKDFADGYANNVLIAKGLAIKATPSELAKLEAQKARMEKVRQEESSAFEALIASIGNSVVILKARANEKGHLFSAVSKKDVAQAIHQSANVIIEEDAIVFPQVIKEVGSHEVMIKKGDREGKCTVVVENTK